MFLWSLQTAISKTIECKCLCSAAWVKMVSCLTQPMFFNWFSFQQLDPYDYKGSWADNFHPLNGEALSESEDDFPHVQDRCLRCMNLTRCTSKSSIKSASRRISKEKEERKISKSPLARTDGAFPKKKLSSSSLPQIDPDSDDSYMVHKEILRLIVNLSSSVASKASQQGLIQWVVPP